MNPMRDPDPTEKLPATSEPTLSLGGSPGDPAPLARNIGPYAVKEVLAQGGMGVVYRVHDPKLGSDVALKMMIGGSWAAEEATKRFLREAYLLRELSHPGIVPVHDMGIEKGAPYYTMDLVEGAALDKHVQERRLDLQDRLKLFIQVLHAVGHAHMKGVIHRDLKPGNILVTPEGQPVVLDFGIAHLARMEGADLYLTVSGIVMGTPLYMAPEQAQGKVGQIDVRTDVYSLGVILYELVTGKLPFEAAGSFALMKAVIEEEPRRPSTWGMRIPQDLEAVILKSIAKERERRYRSAGEFADDLGRFLEGKPVAAHPDTGAYRLKKWAGRHRELSASIAAAAVLLGLAVWQVYAQWRQTQKQQQITFLIGEAAFQGASAEQIEILGQARQLDPRNTKVLHLLARALHPTNRRKEAETILREAVRLDPEDPEVLGGLGRILLEDGSVEKRKEGLLLVRKAYALDPRPVRLDLLVGALEDAGEIQEAIHRIGGFLRSKSRFPAREAAVNMFRPARVKKFLHRNGRWGDLLELLEKERGTWGTDWYFHCERGECLAAMGKLDEALAAYTRSVELDRVHPEAICACAAILDKLGRFDEAEAKFEMALTIPNLHPGKREICEKALEGLRSRR